MKPSTFIKQEKKTIKEQLSLAFKVLDEYLSPEEVKHVLNSLQMPLNYARKHNTTPKTR